MCSGKCPFCGEWIIFLAFRLRLWLDLPIGRGKCSGCQAYFTFLPQFVCPGKWYGYVTIEAALVVVAQATSPNAAFQAWEEKRELLEPAAASRTASTRTIGRWWKELGQDSPERPWFERANTEGKRLLCLGWPGPVASCGPEGQVGEKTVTKIPEKSLASFSQPFSPARHSHFFAFRLLKILWSLGETLLERSPPCPSTSILGLGLWFLEPFFWQRCLARGDLVGRVVPGSLPEMPMTTSTTCWYSRTTSLPP